MKLNSQLELARIQAQAQNASVVNQQIPETSNSKKKFTLPKLQFRQFGDDLKEWLPFWSQFEHIDKDDDIAPENKFQYLVQATVIGSRAREVVESFPPTGENYSKAVDSFKTRFGREDILVEVYVRELLKLITSVQSNQKLSPTFLYDKLESYLRALETLGVTTDKCASILYPMVESCFDEEFLKAWNRSPASSSAKDPKQRLDNLMLFLKGDVEGKERISLAMSGFGLTKSEDMKMHRKKKYNLESQRGKVPTASMLLTSTGIPETKKNRCIFCDGKHASPDCFNAQKLTLEEKQKIVRNKNCCFACLLPGHSVRKYRIFLKCLICSKKHVPLMCDQLHTFNKTSQKKEEEENSPGNDVNLSNLSSKPKVFLQTFKAKLLSGDKEKTVRVLCDTGSQRSYILKNIAEEMKYPISRQETIIHSLFGGVSTKEYKHNCYKIKLKQLNGNFCNFEVLYQTVICESVLPVNDGPWLDELKDLGVVLTDTNAFCASIQVLIGADIIGRLLTGRRKILSSGLVAVETHLGWTLMGKVPQANTGRVNLAMSVTSLFVKEAEIADLWKLDVIGIKDPMEKMSKLQQDLKTKEHFRETVTINEDKRYEVCLPWSDDSSPLPDNFSLAKKRLEVTTEKLLSLNLYEKYDKVFQEWLDEGIIEEVPPNEVTLYGNYLPHRPVIKESSSTTPIRPVFDASARLQNHPSLNQCLQSGPNLIELIPDILVLFREKKFGVTADIRKAFLQISVSKEDRNYLRFLWWKNLEEKKLRVFRHARVVFGIKSSPFLLASVIEYHIEDSKGFDCEFRKILQQSFYVDNVLASFDNYKNLNNFISKSSQLMSQGGFYLRDWEYTGRCKAENDWETPVLGLKWNRQLDSLKVNMNWMNEFSLEKITKRVILSVAHKVFDPIGYTTPVMLCPKLMLQKAWKMDIGWDMEITGNLRKEFLQWFKELKNLEEINIFRWIHVTEENLKHCTIHTFCDASKDAYAAVVFLRLEEEGSVRLSLLAAKSRIAPLRGGTIPRMELLAALVGARLTNSVVEALNWKEVKCFYWSDSTTVLAWIHREENWSIFVRNRIQEIRKLTSPLSWNHVYSKLNPADLPSRGCTATQLVSLRWWEGPQWLTEPPEFWHHGDILSEDINEEEILKEKLKSTKSMTNTENVIQCDRIYSYFSKYQQIIRLVGWILRFRNNCLCRKEKRTQGDLTFLEFQKAELKLVKIIQQESFDGEEDKRFKGLAIFVDGDKILRVKTQIINRKDEEDFRKPMLLPSNHEVVLKLIDHYHKNNLHCGPQILQNLLREKFWILNGRKVIRKIISKCVTCKRFTSKKLEVDSGPLPENRVRDAAVFQITGVDAAGPLFLRGDQKAWVLLFTCAIYRAVHLELVISLSTEAFLLAFRRFVARRGRCSTIYCDNGTNFIGAANLLRGLDWNKIVKFGAINAIDWKFNPPTASWWGGWWERLIRIMKDLLKRVLGRAQLLYEEMVTILCDCEALMNSRPLTYQSEKEQLVPVVKDPQFGHFELLPTS